MPSDALGDKWDVCVVGCGATGSVVAGALARSGLRVIALEAGPAWEAPDDFVPDELESYAFANKLGPKWNNEPVTWENPRRGVIGTGLGIHMMNGVGGSANHYAAHAWRFHPKDFRLRSTVIERYGKESIPEASTLVDWPLSYDDLEPYYRMAEETIGVSGRAGALRNQETGEITRQAGGNPFEGPRSSEYPMPPLRIHKIGSMVAAAGERLGLHPFVGPTAINSVSYRGRPATNYCGFCLGYGCRIGAKGSPAVTILPDALWSGNLEIVPDAVAVRLNTGRTPGRIESVTILSDDTATDVNASIFVLATYTFENVRLLLLSRGADHPGGVGNRFGLVGKHFMTHRYDSLAMVYQDEYTNRFGGPQGQRVVIDDFNSDNFDHNGLGFIAGAHIFAPNEFHPIQDLSLVPPGIKSWGGEYKAYVKEYWNRSALLMTNVEVLPYEDNYLYLGQSVDACQRPNVVARISIGENEERLISFVLARMTEIAEETGAKHAWPLRTMVVPSQHDSGGTRMGESPETSVVDPYGQVHGVGNLFIAGPSVFPTASGLNPSLTAQALAWRTADRIVETI